LFRCAGEAAGFFRHRFKVDHGHVAARLEVTRLVENIGDAARHAGSEVAPGLAQHNHDPAGHVFAAVVAGAFDNGNGTGVAHAKRSPATPRK
jgi:hypothetical protein